MSNKQEQIDTARLQQAVAERKNEVARATARGTLTEIRQAYTELSRAMFACKQAEAGG